MWEGLTAGLAALQSARAGRRRRPPIRRRPGGRVKPISLALQGGGSHGAFTWGVIDHLLEDGRLAIEAFFRRFMPKELRGPPKVLFGEGHSFSDVAKKVVSIINLASVAAVETAAGAPVNPLRFRGNIYVSGWPAWHEFGLLDREITVGGARLKTVKRIQRCAATEVDPDTGIRDVAVPRTLMDNFGHADCGVLSLIHI